MLGENIKMLRKAKGLSQEELAVQLHVVRQTVSKWEKNLCAPDADMLTRLADALDTTVSVLLDAEAPHVEPAQTIDMIAAKLEVLNAQVARQAEQRRRGWRCCFAALLVGALLGLAALAAEAGYGWYATRQLAAREGLIGGADAPAQMWISGNGAWLAATLCGLAGLFGLWQTRRKGE